MGFSNKQIMKNINEVTLSTQTLKSQRCNFVSYLNHQCWIKEMIRKECLWSSS